MKKISFQGELGAYSHEACTQACPDFEPLPCRTFEDAITEVVSGRAELAMLPIENSTYGRVADMHRMLPGSDLQIIGETFLRVRISLLAPRGSELGSIQTAMSHIVLLGQCQNFLKKHGIQTIVGGDTAGSAKQIAELGDPTRCALASKLAAEIYGLVVLAEDIEDSSKNTTRFIIMAKKDRAAAGVSGADDERPASGTMMTSFVFRVRNIPAALYKALGGFATNGVNMTKLESYMVNGEFTATQFYADIEGSPSDKNVSLAMEELEYFTSHIMILGTYLADRRRVHPGGD
jgi:prephenate dehydratase